MIKYGVGDGEVIETGEIEQRDLADGEMLAAGEHTGAARPDRAVSVQEILDEGTAGESPCRS